MNVLCMFFFFRMPLKDAAATNPGAAFGLMRGAGVKLDHRSLTNDAKKLAARHY